MGRHHGVEADGGPDVPVDIEAAISPVKKVIIGREVCRHLTGQSGVFVVEPGAEQSTVRDVDYELVFLGLREAAARAVIDRIPEGDRQAAIERFYRMDEVMGGAVTPTPGSQA